MDLNWYHGSASPRSPYHIIRFVVVVFEEPAPCCRARWRLHFHRKVGSWIHRVDLAVGVRNLLHVNLVEHDSNTNPRTSMWVINEDKLATLVFRDVAKERDIS
jgi:hypothetical protein